MVINTSEESVVGSLVVVEFVTLDGVMQGFGSQVEDRDGGFDHGGWGPPYADETQFKTAIESLASTSAYLFGRRTYEKMAEFWPHQSDDNPMARHLNRTPKYVATHTSQDLSWHNAHLLAGELPVAVSEVKDAHDGNVVVLGSGVLVEQLMGHDLVDRYHLYIHPLLLGTGKRLFRELEQPRLLRLVDVTATGTGVLSVAYEVDRDS
jgi:dihydrofolate reductase